VAGDDHQLLAALDYPKANFEQVARAISKVDEMRCGFDELELAVVEGHRDVDAA